MKHTMSMYAGSADMIDAMQAEIDRLNMQFDQCLCVLNAINGLISPENVKEKDGYTYDWSIDVDAAESLRELSRRIRSIPGEIAEIAAAKQRVPS
jgi:hypothetical protein